MVFTGEETGVIKALEAAIATTIANAIGDMDSFSAKLIAIGATKIAVAVLEMKSPTTAVNKNSTMSTAYMLHPCTSCNMPSTAKASPPVFCRAIENGIIPIIKIKLCQ